MNVPPLRTVFESLTDPLADQRRSQALGRTLTLVFIALISGENSEQGIAAWIEEQRGRLKSMLGYKRDAGPSYRTIQRALQAVDAQELESKRVEWARQVQHAASPTDWEGGRH